MSKEYIEREECLTELNHIINEYVADNSVQCNIAAGTAIDIRDNVIVKLLAADVKPVVHGEWITCCDEPHLTRTSAGASKFWFTCSICGRKELHKEPYCNCGAKMDGGK